MDQISEETRFMISNKIETIEDLKQYEEQNNIKLEELVSKRTNLWKKYKRAKTEDDKVKIYNEIEKLQPIIKELYKNRKYCNGIKTRTENIKNKIDNFDKGTNLDKEKNYYIEK